MSTSPARPETGGSTAVRDTAVRDTAVRDDDARPKPATRTRALLVCSSGGHLLLLHQLQPWWEQQERLWVTFRKLDSESLLAGEQVAWAYHPVTRNVGNFLRNLKLAWRVVREYRPNVVVSTGAGVALPIFVVARMFKVKTVYVEAYERIESRSLTGRLCYPLSDLFLLQWEDQKRLYPRGEVIGRLL